MSIYDKDCEEGCRLLKVERDKIEAIRNAFPVLKSYIDVGDKIGISSAVGVIDEILEAEG